MIRTSLDLRMPLHISRIYCRLALVVAVGLLLSSAFSANALADAAKDAPAVADKNAPADAAEDASASGRLIRIHLPLTDRSDTTAINNIKRVVEELKRSPRPDNQRPTLVLELTPARNSDGAGEGTPFSRAFELASFLSKMTAVKTVAYIPRTIKGHGVLIALACDKIVINPEAELGEAAIDEDASRPLDQKILVCYTDIAQSRQVVPLAIAIGMVNRRAEVLKVETDKGIDYVLRENLDAFKKDHTIISEKTIMTPGSLGTITGSEGREFGLLSARDTETLARALSMPVEALREDSSNVGPRIPVMLDVIGPITRHTFHQLKTILGTELKNHHVNWIGVRIDSEGGELADCQDLAAMFADLDSGDVKTVAYVPANASGGAALVALACDELVMHPGAYVGGKGAIDLDRKTLDDAREPIRESLAKRPDRTWSLIASTIDPQVELFTYHNQKTGENRYFSDDEAKEQRDANDWQRQARVKPADQPLLRMDSKRAEELGIASHIVDSYDELRQTYGIDGDIRTAEPNWAFEFIEALASPGLAVLLIVIGFVGVYIELHSPGVGLGGFVAAVAFLLFFWSKYLDGTAEWLEVLLFLGGVFCLLIEVLVLPGFGIFGLGGGAMILAALILASQTFVLPRTESQMIELRHSLTIVAAASLIVVASSIALRRYLPSTPIFKKLLLNPPPEEDLIDLDHRESLVDFSHLIGEQGLATTNLMPSGKAEFNGQLVDVIAEGLPVDRGAAVTVVKTRGNRVVVRAIET